MVTVLEVGEVGEAIRVRSSIEGEGEREGEGASERVFVDAMEEMVVAALLAAEEMVVAALLAAEETRSTGRAMSLRKAER